MKKIYNPEEYSIDFLKEKIKPFCYYLYSCVGNRHFHVKIFLIGNTDDFPPIEDIVEIRRHSPCTFLWIIETFFDAMKAKFCYQMPNTPFRIMIVQVFEEEDEDYKNEQDEKDENEEEDSEEEDSEEEEEIRNKQINTEKTFKLDECVIYLTNPPNVLFCNCGHLCLCEECDKMKSLKICPVCKTENYIKRNI